MKHKLIYESLVGCLASLSKARNLEVLESIRFYFFSTLLGEIQTQFIYQE